MVEQGYFSYHRACSRWNQTNEIITIKLNCNDWTVTHYDNKREVKHEDIEPNKAYYFGLFCHVNYYCRNFSLQAIECPFNL